MTFLEIFFQVTPCPRFMQIPIMRNSTSARRSETKLPKYSNILNRYANLFNYIVLKLALSE